MTEREILGTGNRQRNVRFFLLTKKASKKIQFEKHFFRKF